MAQAASAKRSIVSDRVRRIFFSRDRIRRAQNQNIFDQIKKDWLFPRDLINLADQVRNWDGLVCRLHKKSLATDPSL
jgi:hypothetical protein